MGDTKRDKAPLPFYELPPHIKPCSQIIQETRLQLKYSAKIGSDIDPSVGSRNVRSPAGDHVEFVEGTRLLSSRMSNYELDLVSGSSGSGRGGQGQAHGMGIHVVHTKRPFTPRESVNLWGLSAQKRPPSAITLSRLSLDESDSSRPSSRSQNDRGKILRKTTTADVLHRYDSVDSGIGGPLLRNSAKIHAGDTEIELEKTRLRFKALSSLHGKTGNGDNEVDQKKAKVNVTAGGHQSENGNNKTEELETRMEYFDKVNSLEVAAECLQTCLESPGKVTKADLVRILTRVKELMSPVPPVEPLKTRLTKLIFKIVEKNSNEEDVLFWASFILLHCQIIGNNLTTIFKMVFKASRSQAFSEIIQKSEYLDVFMYSLGEICPMTQTESMIYGYGTLKFLCAEEPVLHQVLDLNLISVMVLHLKILNYEASQMKKVPGNIQNGVFQLTSILRSVVGIESTLSAVAESGLLDEICNSLSWTLEDIDVISNIVRILSVSSSNEICCEMLSESHNLSSAVVKILKAWHSKDSIVVRLTYCLGNLLAKHEEIRVRLYQEPLALQMIIQVICYYLENFTETSEDILIKSIRILANWSLCPSIGRELCEVERVSEILNSLLEAEEVSNELLLCTISTLNNLSYHKDCVKLDPSNIKTAECLYNYLNLKNIEVRTETMKVLGNLTRNEVVRGAAAAHVGTMLISLKEENSELLCATIGVLMNIILEEGAKEEFVRKGGVEYLSTLMETKGDVGLSLMICQLLWNLVVSGIRVDNGGVEHCDILEKTQMEYVAALVGSRMAQEEAFLQKDFGDDGKIGVSGSGDDVGEGEEESYQEICLEFVSVAKNLHEKLRMLAAGKN